MDADAVIETERLKLCHLRMADAATIAEQIGDVRVLRNLTSPPYPYQVSDAEWFIGEFADSPNHLALWTDRFIGVMTLDDDLGYWLGVDHWGHGYATEAAKAILARHFATSDKMLTSGHVLDNTASRNVLRKMGFRDTHRRNSHIPARGGTHTMQRMELTADDWAFACDPKIRTARLLMKPLTLDDAARISVLGGDPDVSRMLASVTHPFTVEDAQKWIAAAIYKGRPGFRFGIWQADTLIGVVMIGGDPVSAAYWLGKDHWGQGYATEAMAQFLAVMVPKLNLTEVVAEAFVENAASQRVLSKLGFEKTGEGQGKSAARLEPAPYFAYRLAAENLKASL